MEGESPCIPKNVSYLQARDPSILSWNFPAPLPLSKVRLNFTEEVPVIEIEENDNLLKVYLRIKGGVPFNENLYKVENKTLVCKIPEDSYAARNVRDGELVTKKYTFTHIFGPDSKQADLFNYIVKPKILQFINGVTSTLMTYGTTSAGKTFTVVGSPEEPGIIPRALEYLFRTLPELKDRSSVKPTASGKVQKLTEALQKDEQRRRHGIVNGFMSQAEKTEHIKTYKAMQTRLSGEPVGSIDLDSLHNVSLGVWVSFAEIYNEHIYDLLQPPPARGHQRPKLKLGSSNGQTYIKNLTFVNVAQGIDAFLLLQYGLHNLNYAATALNSHSSRSHCIFTIKLVQRHDFEHNTCVSSFHFCDLAGSERSKKTQNVGERLVESNNINASLLVLGRCISNIRTVQQQHKDTTFVPPFRESKLTQLFQRALTGHEDISMIVNISPTRHLFDETNHVLNFSAVAREIICEEPPKPEAPKHRNKHSEFTEKRLSVLRAHANMESAANKEEVNRLAEIIEKLTAELEWVKLDAAEEINETREHMMKGYTELLELTEQNYKQKIKDLEEKHREEVRKLKERYEMDSSNDSDIIVIDEDIEELKTEKRNLKKLLENKEEEKEKYNMLRIKAEADKRLFEKNLEEQKELTKCLMLENKDLQIAIMELKKENYSLREKLNDLNIDLEKYMINFRENTELLESLHKSDDTLEGKENLVMNDNFEEPILSNCLVENQVQDLLQELRRS